MSATTQPSQRAYTASDVFQPFLQDVFQVGGQYPENKIQQTKTFIDNRYGPAWWEQNVATARKVLNENNVTWQDLNPDATGYPLEIYQEQALGEFGNSDPLPSFQKVYDNVADREELKKIGQFLQEAGRERFIANAAANAAATNALRRQGATTAATTTTTTSTTIIDTTPTIVGGANSLRPTIIQVEGAAAPTLPRPAAPPARPARGRGGGRGGAGRGRGQPTRARQGEEVVVPGSNAQARRMENNEGIRLNRSIAIAELDPIDEESAPPNVFNWPLDGPGASNYVILHAVDIPSVPRANARNNVVIVDTNMWPPAISVYDYRVRRLQPRWVTADGRWLVRRTVKLEDAQLGAYKREFKRWKPIGEGDSAVRGDVVQTAQAVKPPQQEYIDVYASLAAMLQGAQPTLSILFPSQTTHDFPEFIATAGLDNTLIIAMSSTLQMVRNVSHPWFYNPLTAAREEFSAAVEIPLANPIERPSVRSYIAGVTFDAQQQTILVWNGRGYRFNGAQWQERYNFESSDLGMNVVNWSSVIDEQNNCFYINNMTLRKTAPEEEPLSGASSSQFVEPFDGTNEKGGKNICGDEAQQIPPGIATNLPREQTDDDDNVLGANGMPKLNDLYQVCTGPTRESIILKRKPFNTKNLAFVYNTRDSSLINLRRTQFGLRLETLDVPFVHYVAAMRTQHQRRHVLGGRDRRQPLLMSAEAKDIDASFRQLRLETLSNRLGLCIDLALGRAHAAALVEDEDDVSVLAAQLRRRGHSRRRRWRRRRRSSDGRRRILGFRLHNDGAAGDGRILRRDLGGLTLNPLPACDLLHRLSVETQPGVGAAIHALYGLAGDAVTAIFLAHIPVDELAPWDRL